MHSDEATSDNVVPSVYSVCLVMIVKNESAVIERCLHSVLPHVAAWCITDTGSTDDTKAKIMAVAAAHGKADARVGRIVDAPWVDFGSNRTDALAAARAHAPACAWQLMMDADDDLTWSAQVPAALAAHGNAEGFRVKVEFAGGMTQYRTHVFATHAPWVYCGVLHEYPALRCGVNAAAVGAVVSPTLPALPGIVIRARCEGARAQNPNKYVDDALVLERQITRRPDDTRALFYCAQSWRDAGGVERAVELYRQVAASPTSWSEERYIACVNIIRLAADPAVVQAHAFLAPTFNARRREATTAWLMRARTAAVASSAAPTWTQEMLALGVLMMTTTPDEPDSAWLFVEPDVYAWRAGDEVSVCAFYTGHKPLARKLMGRILPRVPEAHRGRIFNNMRLCGT